MLIEFILTEVIIIIVVKLNIYPLTIQPDPFGMCRVWTNIILMVPKS